MLPGVDDFARRLSAEYSLFLLALTGRYQQIRAPGLEPYPGDISKLTTDAGKLAAAFYNIAERSLDDYLKSNFADASETSADGLVIRKKETLGRIRAMTLENIGQVVTMARMGQTRFADVLLGSTGSLGVLLQRQLGKIQLKSTDASGRRWSAEKLFRVVVRDFAYQAYIDDRIARIVAAGGDMVVAVSRDSAGQVVKTATFSISGKGDGPSLAEVRGVLFHPNSNNDVEPFDVRS